MTSFMVLLVLLFLLVALSAAASRWGVDSRRAGGWSVRAEGEPLWADRRW